MHQRRTFQAPRKSDNVLRADDVRPQRTLERRIEGYVAGGVDNDIDAVGELLCFFFRVAKIRFANIAAQHRDFVADESFKSVAITLAYRVERRRGDYAIPETRL